VPEGDQVRQWRERAARIPDRHPDRPQCLAELAMALHDRFEDEDGAADLLEAVRVAEEAADLAESGHPYRGLCLAVLGHALRAARKDSERVIAALSEAAVTLPDRHPGLVLVYDDLAMLHSARYQATGELADLDKAITTMAGAAHLADRNDPDRSAYAVNVGLWHTQRYERCGRAEDARQAVEWLEWALAGTDDEDDRVRRLAMLSDALCARAEADGAATDLDRAIDIALQILDALPGGDHRRGQTLSALDLAHLARYEISGAVDDLQQAVRFAEAAVRHAGDPHDQVMYRSNLANRLADRFVVTGDVEDLDRALGTLAEAVATVPDGHPDRPGVLSNYGTVLVARHRVTGDADDLEEAIDWHRQAVVSERDSDLSRARYLSNLGSALTTRYEQTDDADALNQAVDAHDRAERLIPVEHADRRQVLANLVQALVARHEVTGAVDDLDRAVAVSEEAQQCTPGNNDAVMRHQTTVAQVFQARSARTGDRADLDRAVAAAGAALAATPDGRPDQAACLSNLARAHDLRFAATGDSADRRRAAELGARAAGDVLAPYPVRMEAAWQNGRRAAQAGDWTTAAESFAAVVRMLPMVALRRGRRISQERVFAEWLGAPSVAAACALMAGRTDDAIRVLEQGRGVLWAQGLDRRADLSLIEQRAPALARQIRHVGTQLGEATGRGRQLVLAREWETLMARAGADAALGEELRPPTVDRLRRAAAGGPVILLNASSWRCDALVVTRHDSSVVPLPALTMRAYVDHAKDCFYALDDPDPQRRERVLTTVLEWLWDAVAEPVLSALGHTRAPGPGDRWPRVTWCPTGPLALLPIHAAGYHRPEHAADGRSVLDRVVSSYTTTLRAAAKHTEVGPGGNGRMLFVGMPETPDQANLTAVVEERDVVVGRLGRSCTVLEGRAATREAVRQALTQHGMVHFSCHGHQDMDAPSTGGFLLHDGTLSVADLMREGHRGDFAFLSACETALGSVDVADEAVTLAAAMQYAGWRHVIATLWTVSDRVAADVTTRVYKRIAAGGRLDTTAAAEALHLAVRELRERRRAVGLHYPSEWVSFIHIGGTGP
jgi:tetratricopeptide (TPR) repeat protein